jgi:hypothetical protein
MKPEEYPLIPMSEITDEARKIAVAWMECEDKHWIGQKHKLASDIMNYAKIYHSEQQEKEEQPNSIINDCIHFDCCQGRYKCCNNKVKSNVCIGIKCGEYQGLNEKE